MVTVVVKNIIVRAMDGEVEHFSGENLKMILNEDGSLSICRDEAKFQGQIAIFSRWEYAREKE